MNKLGNVGKVIVVGVVAVILVVIIIVYSMGNGNAPATNTSTLATNATVEASGTETANVVNPTNTGGAPVAKSPSTAAPRLPANLTISFITPITNDIWTIGTDNPISWDKVGNITGSLSLIDAITGQTVGVILPSVGPQQTSFTWNVRDVFLNETSPLKKDVVPGTYEIRLTYNGNDIPPTTSPKFTITN